MDDKIQGGRATLAIVSALCVAACSITAWPELKQVVHAVFRVLRCTVLSQPDAGCVVAYPKRPGMSCAVQSQKSHAPESMQACAC